MTPKEKTILQICKESVGTIVLVIIAMGLPALFAVGMCENWNKDITFLILLFNVFESLVLYALIDNNL